MEAEHIEQNKKHKLLSVLFFLIGLGHHHDGNAPKRLSPVLFVFDRKIPLSLFLLFSLSLRGDSLVYRDILKNSLNFLPPINTPLSGVLRSAMDGSDQWISETAHNSTVTSFPRPFPFSTAIFHSDGEKNSGKYSEVWRKSGSVFSYKAPFSLLLLMQNQKIFFAHKESELFPFLFVRNQGAVSFILRGFLCIIYKSLFYFCRNRHSRSITGFVRI